jgi:hypothetical protein
VKWRLKINIKKINKTKNWFFEKINKSEKPLVKLSKGKERQDPHQ